MRLSLADLCARVRIAPPLVMPPPAAKRAKVSHAPVPPSAAPPAPADTPRKAAARASDAAADDVEATALAPVLLERTDARAEEVWAQMEGATGASNRGECREGETHLRRLACMNGPGGRSGSCRAALRTDSAACAPALLHFHTRVCLHVSIVAHACVIACGEGRNRPAAQRRCLFLARVWRVGASPRAQWPSCSQGRNATTNTWPRWPA